MRKAKATLKIPEFLIEWLEEVKAKRNESPGATVTFEDFLPTFEDFLSEHGVAPHEEFKDRKGSHLLFFWEGVEYDMITPRERKTRAATTEASK